MLRPFWKKHPWLLRAAAVGALFIVPVVWLAALVIAHIEDLRYQYQLAWGYATKGEAYDRLR